MADVKPCIFISYARSDGETFATELRRRLAEEVGEEQLWQDRAEMEGGVGWWKQIANALDNVEFMVLVATPNAMQSPVVRKEWRYARQQGVCVYPVQVPEQPIDFEAMPRWMRDSHFYSLDKEWETFVNYLKSKCEAVRVPFMPPDLPTHFVERPDEFDALITQLLDDKRENPVAISTSLTGAGGFGKTTLATALCHHEDVQTAFDDGILWVTLGEQPDIVGALTKLYQALTGEQPSFVDIEQGKTQLSAKLADNDCLIVIDDVWDSGHLRPFLQGGERCARLITTRFVNIAVGADAQVNDVDQMSTAQAVQMLTAGLDPVPTDLTPFEALADRLGEWALMLEITNGMIRERMTRGNSPERALEWVNRTLDKRGIMGIKRDDQEQRKQSALGVLSTNIEMLDSNAQIRLFQLAVFHEDSDIPLTSMMALWGLDDFDTEEQLAEFDRYSLLKLDLEGGTIRLHDVVREVLETHLIKQQPLEAIHAQLITGYGDLHALPDSYAWANIAYHLMKANQSQRLHELLFDLDWLMARMNGARWVLGKSRLGIDTRLGMDINGLLNDCDYLRQNYPDVALLQSALRLSSHIIISGLAQLPAQILGRLGLHREEHSQIDDLLKSAENFDDKPALLLNTPSLQPAGGALIRTIPVGSRVNDLALSDDRQFMLTASSDNTVQVWNWHTGEHLRTLEGHTNSVLSVTMSDTYALSTSSDNTVRVWNWHTGEHLQILEGHLSSVISVTVNEEIALSASDDGTVRVWNWMTGKHLRTLEGHLSPVMSVAVSEEIALSASWDRTVRVWNWHTGEHLRTLEGHTDYVNSVTTSDKIALCGLSDGTVWVWNWVTGEHLRTLEGHSWMKSLALSDAYALSASYDNTIQVWNWMTGEHLHTLEGHTDYVNSVATNGKIALSASSDKTVRVWNWMTDEHLRTMEKHDTYISDVIVNSETVLSVSSDTTVRVWNWMTGEHLRTLEPLSLKDQPTFFSILSATMSKEIVLFASNDNKIYVWNWMTGEYLRTLEGHTNWVRSVTTNGEIALSASNDRTVRVWNWQTGEHLRTLEGHTGTVWSVTVNDVYALSGSDNGAVRVWNWQTGEHLRTLEGHISSVMSVAVSGEFALSASWDRTVRVWNWMTGEHLRTLEEHTNSVRSVTVSDAYALSASSDKTVRVWNWHKGDCLAVFTADGGLNSVAIDEETGAIVAGGASGRVHFLRANAKLRRLMSLPHP